MKSISERIIEGMTIRNMKQVDIIEKTGINKGALSSYISGKYEPKQTNIYLIAKALNVSEAWLMGHDVPMDRKIPNIHFDDKVNNTPYNRALIKLSKKETLTEEEAVELKRELSKAIEYIPDAFLAFTETIESSIAKRIFAFYSKLNSEGKAEALKRIEELTYINKYTDSSNEILNAAHDRPGATDEEKAHDDEIMNDENF